MLQFGLLALIILSLSSRKHSALQGKISLVVIRKGNRFLLLRRSATDSWKPGYWALPGGHVEAGESFRAAAIREIKEETNIDIQNPQLVAEKENMRIYEATTNDNPSLLQASHGYEHSDWMWASKNNLPSPLVPNLWNFIFS